jgi:hypothetical protein
VSSDLCTELGVGRGGGWRRGGPQVAIGGKGRRRKMLNPIDISGECCLCRKQASCSDVDIGSHISSLDILGRYLATVPGRLDDNIFGPC